MGWIVPLILRCGNQVWKVFADFDTCFAPSFAESQVNTYNVSAVCVNLMAGILIHLKQMLTSQCKTESSKLMDIMRQVTGLEQSVHDVSELIDAAAELYHRLILVVGRGRSGKSTVLRSVATATGGTCVDVGLALTKALLAYAPRQAPLKTPELLAALVDNATQGPVLLDNTDILFDKLLAADPLLLLQRVARSQTLVVAWRGYVERGMLRYALPDHRDSRSYPAHDLLIVDLNDRTLTTGTNP